MEMDASTTSALPLSEDFAEIHLVIDVDSFESQVWIKENPELQGRPVIFVNEANVTLAVSYEAKAKGVTRKHSLTTGRAVCPELEEFRIPNEHGKPNQSKGRNASYEIHKTVRALVEERMTGSIVAMKSKDEVYIEVGSFIDKMLENQQPIFNFSPHSKTVWIPKLVEGSENAGRHRLALAGMMANELLQAIKNETGYIASAGVAGPLVVAKIACGNDKPNALTIVTLEGHDELYNLTKIRDTPRLKGRHGELITQLFTKPDGSCVDTLLDFKKYVPVDDYLCSLLSLNRLDMKCLQGLVQGKDYEKLAEYRKKTLISSNKVPIQDFTDNSKRTLLKKYIANCCIDMEDKVRQENELLNRLPKDLQIKFERRNFALEPTVGVPDTTTVNFPRNDFSATNLEQCVWNGLRNKWKELRRINKSPTFDAIRRIILTARFSKDN